MKLSEYHVVLSAIICGVLSGCQMYQQEPVRESQKIVVTSPEVKAVTTTQRYVCQIHSKRHINVRALERGYLEEIEIKEGQEVALGDVLFKIVPVIYEARFDAEQAERDHAKMEYEYTQQLAEGKVVSKNELALQKAKLAQAEAKVKLAKAELNFTSVKAPFSGIIDRLLNQTGSLVEEGDTLTTLSDNSTMWVYFNVPEASYLEYMTDLKKNEQDLTVQLVLANGKKFSQTGKIGAIEADFNNKTGNIPFRADFQNPDRLLRHGQTGTVLITRVQANAVVIPQRATFPILDKRFVYVVDDKEVAHQREIEIESEQDDIFVIRSGLDVSDKIVLEGVRQVHDGDKVQYENRSAEQVMAHLKYHAE